MFVLDKPTKAKLHKTDDKAIKVGQKDTKDAVIVNFTVVLPNTALDMLDPGLRTLLYSRANPGEKQRKQAELDGVDAVTDTPALTKAGERMRTVSWDEEQTGCTLVLDYGIGGKKSNLVLKDGTNKLKKVTSQEGGSVKINCHFHAPTDHLNDDEIGRLHRQHQKEITITLAGPSVPQQSDLEDEDGAGTPTSGATVTPIQALAAADKAAKSGKMAAAGG